MINKLLKFVCLPCMSLFDIVFLIVLMKTFVTTLWSMIVCTFVWFVISIVIDRMMARKGLK